jgi:hypothetical protein
MFRVRVFTEGNEDFLQKETKATKGSRRCRETTDEKNTHRKCLLSCPLLQAFSGGRFATKN